MGYKKQQKKWIKKHDVQVGDFVKVIKQSEDDLIEDQKNSIGKIFNVTSFDKTNMLIILGNGFGYSRKEIKKITDLKEIAPFYVEIESEKQSMIAQEICFSHGIEKDEFQSGTLFIRNRNCKIYCLQFSGPYYNFQEREESRQLTYDQILRFEKNVYGQLQRDIQTINQVALEIINRCEKLKKNK